MKEDSFSDSGKLDQLPARYRPTVWAYVHNALWNLIIILAWPFSILLRRMEKMLHHD